MALTPNAQANPVENLFLNKDQQAKQLLDEEKPAEAYGKFEDPRWKALSAYRMGSYKTAGGLLEKLPQDTLKADDFYNKANALALEGEYEKAIKSYEEAIKREPNHEDAKYNKDIIEQLKQQKDQEQEQQDQNQEGDSEQQEQNEQDSDQQSSDQQSSDQQSSDQQDSEEESEQESQEQQQSEQEQRETELTEEQLKEQFKEEEKDQEMEQWLRRLSDDPGGLLRRKMYREYQRRGHKQHVEKNW
jgi:Ca-activated chloride channel family protein